MELFKNRLFALIITVLITLEIFLFSSITGASSTGIGGNPWIPRTYHLTAFFLFTFFLFILIKGKKDITLKTIILVLTISIIHAIFDEFHQMFVPLRDASITDIFIDSLGIFSAIGIHTLINKKYN